MVWFWLLGKIIVQQFIFSIALDAYHGNKIDIKCECWEVVDLNQIEINNISNQKYYGIKNAYMIENIVKKLFWLKKEEIVMHIFVMS